MNIETPGKLSKFQLYRARKKAAGFREVRLWVRDPNSPRFKAEMEAMASYHRESQEEREFNRFADALAAETLKELPPY